MIVHHLSTASSHAKSLRACSSSMSAARHVNRSARQLRLVLLASQLPPLYRSHRLFDVFAHDRQHVHVLRRERAHRLVRSSPPAAPCAACRSAAPRDAPPPLLRRRRAAAVVSCTTLAPTPSGTHMPASSLVAWRLFGFRPPRFLSRRISASSLWEFTSASARPSSGSAYETTRRSSGGSAKVRASWRQPPANGAAPTGISSSRPAQSGRAGRPKCAG